MSRQHRGISTKDLPVLPMPSAFDPELASRLLAKAGVKISAAELRARASPTSGGGGGGGGGGSSSRREGGVKQEFRGADNDSNMGDMDMMEDDPEDLTMGQGGGVGGLGAHNNNRYHSLQDGGNGGGGGGFSHPNTTITRVRHGAVTPKSHHMADDRDGGQLLLQQQQQQQMPPTGATGSSILDTYLQLIQENTFGKFLEKSL